MYKVTPLFILLISILSLSTPGYASDDDTRELRREIMKLHGDIRMSSASQESLAQNMSLAPSLAKSDDATILAALELVRNPRADSTLALNNDDVAAARHKIEIYKMLCISAKPHPDIYAKFCETPPYQGLYNDYVKNFTKLSAQ